LNAVLDLSRLESGRVVPRYHVFDLRLIIEEAAEQLGPFAKSRGVDLRLRLPRESLVCVRSDAHWLGRAVANLVSNAIKYANTGQTAKPTVIVGVVRSATRARIDVVDNGIGISNAHWEAIFQPFFQVDNPEQDRDKGLGLGLSIVNAVISMLEEHRLELKSAEGLGSRFSVEMPLCGASPEKPSPRLPARTDADEALQLDGLYVLLVEDDGLVRASTEALLSQWGVLFDSAATFEEYEEILDSLERFPDLIITDFRLRDFKTAREGDDRPARVHARRAQQARQPGGLASGDSVAGFGKVSGRSRRLNAQSVTTSRRGRMAHRHLDPAPRHLHDQERPARHMETCEQVARIFLRRVLADVHLPRDRLVREALQQIAQGLRQARRQVERFDRRARMRRDRLRAVTALAEHRVGQIHATAQDRT
jgi:two-component sensor histidine kinase